jgi:hypothetical protein
MKKKPAAMGAAGSKAFQPPTVKSGEPNMTDSTPDASEIAPDGDATPSSLGEFLAALANGPLLNGLRLNVGANSAVRARYARWVAAKQRAALTKFPAVPE